MTDEDKTPERKITAEDVDRAAERLLRPKPRHSNKNRIELSPLEFICVLTLVIAVVVLIVQFAF